MKLFSGGTWPIYSSLSNITKRCDWYVTTRICYEFNIVPFGRQSKIVTHFNDFIATMVNVVGSIQ